MRNVRLNNPGKVVLIVIVTVFAIISFGLVGSKYLRPYVFQLAMPTDYFESQSEKPDEFLEITPSVYSFRHKFNRSLIVDTGEKLAIFDTYNVEHAKALKLVLASNLPGKSIGWVFYSHHHLDHIRGASKLAPESVIAHEDVMSYVKDFPHIKDISPVTLTTDGDTDMNIGITKVEMLYLPRSHSETLYAFYLPSTKVLYLPDLMFKDAIPPFGFPDWYYPGYIRALDRLLKVDAEFYIPSHFDAGTRDDLLSYRNMMVDFRETVLEALSPYEYDAANGERLRTVLKKVYPKLAEKYGHRTGFDAMFISHFGREAAGAYLGY